MQIENTTDLIAWIGFFLTIINSIAVIWTVRFRNERFRAILKLNFTLTQSKPDIQTLMLTVSNEGGRSARIEQMLVFMLPFLEAPLSAQPIQNVVYAGQTFTQTITLPVPPKPYKLKIAILFKDSRFQRKYSISTIEVDQEGQSRSST